MFLLPTGKLHKYTTKQTTPWLLCKPFLKHFVKAVQRPDSPEAWKWTPSYYIKEIECLAGSMRSCCLLLPRLESSYFKFRIRMNGSLLPYFLLVT